jgi:hypothetical protein
MAYRLNIKMRDGLGKDINRSVGLAADTTQAADATNAGNIMDLYATLTDCGVLGGTITQSTKFGPTGFTPTAATAGARYWRVGRISVACTPSVDGVQSIATLDIPGIKAALVGAGGAIVDTGIIATFLGEFVAANKGRLADGQAVSSTSIVSGYADNLPHPGSED